MHSYLHLIFKLFIIFIPSCRGATLDDVPGALAWLSTFMVPLVVLSLVQVLCQEISKLFSEIATKLENLPGQQSQNDEVTQEHLDEVSQEQGDQD